MRYIKSSAMAKLLRKLARGQNKNVNKNTILVTSKANSALKAALVSGGLIGLNAIENELLESRSLGVSEEKQGRCL